MIRDLIIKARKQSKITQSDLSRTTKISTERLSKFENGVDCITLDEAESIIKAVGIKAIFYREDNAVQF